MVAGDAVLGVADQEGEVELGEEVFGEDGRVAGLAFGRVRVGWDVLAVTSGDGAELGGVGSHAALVVYEGGGDLWGLVLRWHPVVGHVFDEDTLALLYP